ncbi:MAG: hypothetical protein A3J62_01055 [Candidatus Buchananbacteria bacterium RIFCSPHIGHO2_02_FULL_38_8]|uniref:Uncharacterized protein n=1 Tax=Candidatus Buchananbacteria bacterium RIFCSPHIGHO2_02_FULL_38_8 TaxID=1797538 RepID=A0A1G1Y7R5_9BACT|nr:MAG: hypothetical protein A3J62_01055 [Candidatus Buchananbacteria bacterium RIFCSPHIGHO2_02_FULL_38_8]
MKKKLQQPEISQIRRIAGQIQGVEKLINQQTKTDQILQQIEAIRGSLKSLEKTLLKPKVKNLKDSELEKTLSYLLKIS